jgi:hypothetical protein
MASQTVGIILGGCRRGDESYSYKCRSANYLEHVRSFSDAYFDLNDTGN